MSIEPPEPGVEWWDVYDCDRRPTGRRHRRGDPLPPGDFHLVVHVCIFNRQGQLLLQRRHPDKIGWPDFWDVSAAGSALAGEDSRQAAVREAREELGIEINLDGLRPRLSVSFRAGFDDFWMVQLDARLEELALQPAEVSDARWASQAELQAMARRGEVVPYVFLDSLFDLYRTSGAILPGP